jgi:hypothetical protein
MHYFKKEKTADTRRHFSDTFESSVGQVRKEGGDKDDVKILNLDPIYRNSKDKTK